MEIPINYWAVLVAGITGMVIGGLWYSPLLFAKYWMELSGITGEKIAEAKARGMSKMYTITFVGTLLMSYVLAHALVFASNYTNTHGLTAGLMAGFWNWLGFVAPVTVGSILWEGKSFKLWILNAGYYLITLLIMGAILALWPAS